MTPIYGYVCKCGQMIDIDKSMKDVANEEKCYCGKVLKRIYTVPNITGTDTSFGIAKGFTTPQGKRVSNYKDWEKEGYKQPKDCDYLPDNVKERAKEKSDKINYYKSRGIDPTGK